MASQAVVGGSVAAAVLGSSLSNTLTDGATVDRARSTKATAVAAANELARTGVSTTQLLVVIGLLLVFAGVLLVGVARRHGVDFPAARLAGARLRSGRGAPLAV